MDEFRGASDKKDHFYWTDLLCPRVLANKKVTVNKLVTITFHAVMLLWWQEILFIPIV